MRNLNSSARAFGAALIVAGCLIAIPAQSQPAEPAPVPEKGTTAQAACIEENDGYRKDDDSPMFVIELQNKCERRMSCRVFAYVTSAKGTALGRGTLLLGPKSAGAAAKKSFTMKVKMVGGNSQSTRECRAL